MCASILRLCRKTLNIVHHVPATRLCPRQLQSTGNRPAAVAGHHGQAPYTWSEIMKALIAALALVTLVASPTFAQTATSGNNAANCYGQGFGPSSACYP